MPTETFFDNPRKKILNLGYALEAMQLTNEIEVKINRALGTKDTLIHIAIRQAIEDKVPYIKIIEMVRDFAVDNEVMIANIIGLSLTKQVLNFGKTS